MLPVSAKFANAQLADANLPVAKVQLLLGDYANGPAGGATASASSSFSADFPASGAINGDRTNLNLGPATAADNGAGRSSWRSGSPVTSNSAPSLAITFSQARTINYIKLYHAAGAGLSRYLISTSDGTVIVNAGAVNGNYPNAVNITSTGTLDKIDLPDISTTSVTIQVFGTAINGDYANIVELEAYHKVDITSRVKSVQVSRQRDYKLANPMAAKVTLVCNNDDRFFSLSHVPTTAESLAGFVNQELRPNMGLLVYLGFNTFGASPELVPAIAGYCDSINAQPKSREATIVGRDGMKGLINQVDSCNLKTNIELSQAVQYILNRNNISSYECSIRATNLFIPYFFTNAEDHLTTIRNLTEAAGDSLFYFDESGTAVFQFYAGALPADFTWPVNQPFSAGVLGGDMAISGGDLTISTAGGVNGETNTATGFSPGFLNIPASVHRVTGVGFRIIPSISGTITQINTPIQFAYPAPGGPVVIRVAICSDSGGSPSTQLHTTTLSFPATNSSTPRTIGAVGVSFPVTASTVYWITFEEDPSTPTNCVFAIKTIDLGQGNWSGGANSRARFVPHGASACPGDPGSTTAWQDVEDSQSAGAIGTMGGSYSIQGSAVSGTWYSPVTDLGVGVTSFAQLTSVESDHGAAVTYSTQSSPDGAVFTALTPIAANGQIQSPANRYVRVFISVSTFTTSTAPLIIDVTVNYTGGAGQRKYPPAPSSFRFSFDSNLLAAAQELADNLGGDTSIINDVTVQAQPLVLAGANSDTVWQGTVGSPPVNVSGSVPLGPFNDGDFIVIAPVVSGGMDVSNMSTSTDPSAAVVTTTGGSGARWSFTQSFNIPTQNLPQLPRVNPTVPVLVIQFLGNGVNVTDLRIVGKTFSNSAYIQAQRVTAPASISSFGDRQLTISNPWITSAAVALSIAQTIVNNFSNPFSYVPQVEVRPTFNAQIGDRVTVVDSNLDLSADYLIVGLDHKLATDVDRAAVQTTATLLAIPQGL